MPEIIPVEYKIKRFISNAPAAGVLAAIDGAGVVQNLIAWDPVTGDVTHSAPAGTGSNTRIHLYDRPISTTTDVAIGGKVLFDGVTGNTYFHLLSAGIVRFVGGGGASWSQSGSGPTVLNGLALSFQNTLVNSTGTLRNSGGTGASVLTFNAPIAVSTGTSSFQAITGTSLTLSNTITSTVGVSGVAIALNNGSWLTWKDSGGTARFVITLSNDDSLYLQSQNLILFRKADATLWATLSGSGLTLNNIPLAGVTSMTGVSARLTSPSPEGLIFQPSSGTATYGSIAFYSAASARKGYLAFEQDQTNFYVVNEQSGGEVRIGHSLGDTGAIRVGAATLIISISPLIQAASANLTLNSTSAPSGAGVSILWQTQGTSRWAFGPNIQSSDSDNFHFYWYGGGGPVAKIVYSTGAWQFLNLVSINNTLTMTAAAIVITGSFELQLKNAANNTTILISNVGASGVATLRFQNASVVEFISIGTTASAANAFLDNAANNSILRSTSSARYKDIVGPMAIEDARGFLRGLDAIWYHSLASADDVQDIWPGFTAERAAELDDAYVTYDRRGRPDWVMYDRIVVPLTVGWVDHEQRIAELESELRTLRQRN